MDKLLLQMPDLILYTHFFLISCSEDNFLEILFYKWYGQEQDMYMCALLTVFYSFAKYMILAYQKL